jgi:hypothetical protein
VAGSLTIKSETYFFFEVLFLAVEAFFAGAAFLAGAFFLAIRSTSLFHVAGNYR